MGTEVPRDDLTQLLERWTKGDADAFKSLVPIVYTELRRMAHQRLRAERQNQTLQTTALVHEAYLRLAQHPPRSVKDHNHFLALAATVMRQVLVDHVREKQAAKREGGIKLELLPEMMPVAAPNLDFVALDAALHGLARLDERQAKIVELRFFAGLSIEDTSEVLGMSPATVKRDWVTARAWLQHEMSKRDRQSRATGASSGQ
ncbi:MAG: sigma-70 family RNA polymerase sigma factor [Acidobacteria bacterium]|nr:sigma-70 family RNA polymerase sigma factor [Acidobacteriota bacterium]